MSRAPIIYLAKINAAVMFLKEFGWLLPRKHCTISFGTRPDKKQFTFHFKQIYLVKNVHSIFH